MQWLDRMIEKWNRMIGKIRPYYQAISSVFRKIGKTFSTLFRYIYMLRTIIMAAPMAAAAVIIASISMRRLPDMVSTVGFTVDRGDPDALFGFLSIYEQTIPRDTAVFGPLILTGISLLMMLLTKRALYPFLVTLFTLILPLFLWFYNTYPM